MNLQLEIVNTLLYTCAVHHNTLVKHLQLIRFKYLHLLAFNSFSHVTENFPDCFNFKRRYRNCWNWVWNVRYAPASILFQQFPQRMIFLCWTTLFIYWSIIIICCQFRLIIILLEFATVSPCSQTKVSPSMNHIHWVGMIAAHQKLVLFMSLFNWFPVPFLIPMGMPARIDLSPKNKAFSFETSGIIKLHLLSCPIYPNIGTWPMTFLEILNPVNIILGTSNSESIPNLS